MSRMALRSSNKPPLPTRSPIMLRSRRKPLQPAVNSNIPTSLVQGTPTNSLARSQSPIHVEKSGIRPEYHTISCELRALAKMVQQELGPKDENMFVDFNLGAQKMSPLFERGKFYDEYSARRNERLKRKKRESSEGCYDLGVGIESCKKKESTRSVTRRVKTVSSTPVVERKEIQASVSRYSLRSSSKESSMKTSIPLPSMMANGERSVGVGERKVGVRRIKKI